MKTLLSFKSLTIGLPVGADRENAVSGVSIDLMANETLCIVGESGSGKSILAHAAMGLLPDGVAVKDGSIELCGRTLDSTAERRNRSIRASEISMIFQEPMTCLNPLMRIGDQIDEAVRYSTGISSKKRREIVLEAIERVGLPDPCRTLKSYPSQLSGGQRQRVMIAIALATNPKVLVADEPTTALDVTTQAQILELLKEIQKERDMSVLLITHDFGVVADVADRVAVMQKGSIVEVGEARRVLCSPSHEYTKRLIDSVPKLAFRTVALSATDVPLLRVRSVCKSYKSYSLFGVSKSVPAVRNVSFDLAHGETLAIVGESGSGKSTLARLILRMLSADDGAVEFGGQDFLRLEGGDLRDAQAKIQMVFQDPYASLNPRATICTQLARGPAVQGTPWTEAVTQAKEMLARVGLAGSGDRYPHEFSGGQRQRIVIARALVLRPSVLVADEPVSALDVTVQHHILSLLEDLQRELKLSMIFITHDLRIAARMGSRVGVMKGGELLELEQTKKIFEEPVHPYTKLLLGAMPGRNLKNPEFEAHLNSRH